MKQLVECAPNFSERRHTEVVEAIVGEACGFSDVYILGKEMDADHNRAFMTLTERVEKEMAHIQNTAENSRPES